MSIRDTLKAVPGLRSAVRAIRGEKPPKLFTDSKSYWEDRYATGGNSGAGSYNRLAEFKAEFLNAFVADNEVKTVVEFGSGDGAQLALAQYPDYTGVDVSETAVRACETRFKSDPTKRFRLSSGFAAGPFDLSLSLDVIYHLIEDSVFDGYMRSLFAASRRFVIVYASNEDKAWPASHVRHRRFTNWVEREEPRWALSGHTPNRYPYDPDDPDHTSFADFYVFERKR